MDEVFGREVILRRQQVLTEFLANKITREQASRLLGVSERSITRLAGRLMREGVRALVHGNKGKRPHNACDDNLKQRVRKLVEEKYYDLNLTHCLEFLREQHQISISYWILREWCHEWRVVKHKRKRRAKPRFRRERMPSTGMLLQMDGSHHEFFGGKKSCLMCLIDDATSEIPFGQFFPAETTVGALEVLHQLIRLKGVPLALYVDRAGWSGKNDGGKRAEFSHFIRACEELKIQIIVAYSPQAKGRIERAFRTLQDRLIPELRMKGCDTQEDANRFLHWHFLPRRWNNTFTTKPLSDRSAYRPKPPEPELKEILCLKYYRKIANDHTFKFRAETYQIKTKFETSQQSKDVIIHVYPAGNWRAFLGKTRLIIKDINH